MESIYIDVREKDEFKAEHIDGSINIPLSTFGQDAPPIIENLPNKKVYIVCRSGNRAKMALNQLKGFKKIPSNLDVHVFTGGIQKWKEEGKKVCRLQRGTISIMRQVQITAGLLILTGAGLGTFVNPKFWFLSAFVGLGLTFAGLTGTCAMASILAHMPWNKCEEHSV